MDARHLTLLRELRDRGSVTAVASAGFRTPSAVSQQLRTAERDLGVRLVEPSGRGLRLTEAGLLLADGATQVEVAIAEVQSRLDAFRGHSTGAVTVASLPSAAEVLLPAAMTELARAGVRLDVTDLDVGEAEFGLLAADHDVVIGHSLTSEVPRGAGDLVRRVLAREPIDVALPSGHTLAARERLHARDVVHEPWIAVPAGFPFRSVVEAIERRTGRQVEMVQQVRDNRLVAALVAAGHGIALLPRFSTRPRDGLVLRPLHGVDSRRWIVSMSRADRAERVVVRRVVETLHDTGRRLERDHVARSGAERV